MFRYELLRNEWVLLILFGGTALVFYVVLYYFDFWQPRPRDEATGKHKLKFLSAFEGIPWSIKIIIFLIVVIMTTYAIVRIIYPKSW